MHSKKDNLAYKDDRSKIMNERNCYFSAKSIRSCFPYMGGVFSIRNNCQQISFHAPDAHATDYSQTHKTHKIQWIQCLPLRLLSSSFLLRKARSLAVSLPLRWTSLTLVGMVVNSNRNLLLLLWHLLDSNLDHFGALVTFKDNIIFVTEYLYITLRSAISNYTVQSLQNGHHSSS